MKKVWLKKLLICILIVVIASNFILGSTNVVYAEDVGDTVEGLFSNVITGLVGILLYPFTLIPTVIIILTSDIVGALAKVSLSDFQNYEKIADTAFVTPFDILFNRIPLVDVNFFKIDDTVEGSTIRIFRESVAGWYYTMRLIASMVLLVVLIYIGIRMATTSIATEKAIYKKMLVDWVTSLALLFLLHYIMLFVFEVNESLVNAMATVAQSTSTTTGWNHDINSYNSMIVILQALCFNINIVVRVTAIVVYGMIVFQTISFLIAYIKRMLTIGFLISIAPLITITYSMDKIGDGKAQALNTWLKEFIYNILLQPFQCILYLIFVKMTFDAMLDMSWGSLGNGNVGTAIFAILCLQFIKEGEKIIKKIFGFDKASTAGDLAVGAAMTAGALIKGKDIAAKAGGTLSKTKNMIAATARENRAKKQEKRAEKNEKNRTEKTETGEKNRDTKTEKATSEVKEGTKVLTGAAGLMKKMSERKEARKEDKVKKEATKLWEKNQQKGSVSDYMGKAEKNLEDKANKKVERKQKISGFVDTAKNSSTGRAIGSLYNFAKDHKKEISGMTIGMFTAGIGMAAGDFGDFSKAIAGYGMGSGFTQGWYANSGKTLKGDSEAASQLYANMTGDTNIASQLANAQIEGMNDISKAIRDAIKDLEKVVGKDEQGKKLITDFRKTAIDPKAAGSITQASIRENLEASGFSGDTDKAVDAFTNLGRLLAAQTLYRNTENAANMGISREHLGIIIGNRNSSNGYSGQFSKSEQSEKTETSEKTEEIHDKDVVETYEERFVDINNIIEAAKRHLGTSTTDVNSAEIDKVNENIIELNALINSLNSQESKESSILTAVKSVNNQITDHNIMVEELMSQLSRYTARKEKLESSQNNN